VGKVDRVASTIGLEIHAKDDVVGRIDDAEHPAIAAGVEHLGLGCVVEGLNVDLRDLIG
jgi:hypothetical protein